LLFIQNISYCSRERISAYFEVSGEKMKVYEVAADELIKAVAEELKKNKELTPPDWIYFVKSGAHRERRPDDAEKFWYLRCASILRKLYIHGNLGVNEFRRVYGGSKKGGVRREKHIDAGGSIIRKALQKLEKIGLVERQKKGRVISGKGKSLLDRISKNLKAPVHERGEEEHEGGEKRRAGRSKKKEAA